jgi:hypothetical protein
MRSALIAVGAAGFELLGAAPAPVASAPLASLVVHWQRYFTIDSQVTSHAYFEAPAAQPATSHRVSVFAFESKKRC